MNPEYEMENVRPYSPSQQEILRIYEDTVLNGVEDIPEDIEIILKKFKENDIKKRPGKSDFLRYKLWLEQQYISIFVLKHPFSHLPALLGRVFHFSS